MRRNTFIIAAVILLACLSGCRRPAATITTRGIAGTAGNNGVIVKDVFGSALGGYQLQDKGYNASGVESSGTVIVKEANQTEVADLLDKRLESLPFTYKWKSHGRTRRGDSYLGLRYEESGHQFYLDFVLNQRDKDVEILVLAKGVDR